MSEQDQVAGATAEYILAYNSAKAAFRAWDATQDPQLFEEAIRAAETFVDARIRFCAIMSKTGAMPPTGAKPPVPPT